MSANQELQPPLKPRVSPLDVRNTDLVSRLLAATPPYLYNMPLVPNSYFFSEMLRSLVQAKSEASAKVAASTATQSRRPRKRSWTQTRSDYYHKSSPKPEKLEPHLRWSPKFATPETESADRMSDKPLQLTMNKTSLESIRSQENKLHTGRLDLPSNSDIETSSKQEMSNANVSLMYPTVPPDLNHVPNPSMWYPSLYPPPYMDPLHFFIDLRVSDHMYDKKNHKDFTTTTSSPKIPSTTREKPTIQENQVQFQNLHSMCGGLKQTRHCSAFSVPIPSTSTEHSTGGAKQKSLKFDVKSMGFDKSYNKTGTPYIMSNIQNIYKTVQNQVVPKLEADDASVDQAESSKGEEDAKETEEEKQKRVKDLRALIGLELVVDYMNHAKPGQKPENLEGSMDDTESSAGSAIEVISVEDNSKDVVTY